jgi:predicted acyl esterase
MYNVLVLTGRQAIAPVYRTGAIVGSVKRYLDFEGDDEMLRIAVARTRVQIAQRATFFVIAMVVGMISHVTAHSETVYPGGKWEPGPARYGSLVVDNVPVTMDDGVVLRASIAYPADLVTRERAKGKFPVVIEHTPYVKLGQPVGPLTYFAEHGYIVTLVRARGTGSSGGELTYSSSRDGADGKTIVDWAAHGLDASDGRIALVGCSYPGGLALTDAAHVGPSSPVRAVVAACNGFQSQNRGTLMRGGLQNSNIRNMVRIIPYLGSTPSAERFINELTADIKAGGDTAYDREFWQDRLPRRLAQNIVQNDIPVLLWSGWQDRVEGAIRSYTALQNASAGRPIEAPMTPTQRTTSRYQLIMGDWGHAAGLDLGIYLQWIETWLKGVDTGIQKTTTSMHLFEVGTNRWVNAAFYPAVADNTRWYLGPSGTLNAGASQGSGADQLVRKEPSEAGAMLRFDSPALANGATLAGPISATIYASSSNTNLELIARLYDIAPDGRATEISLGALLGSQRELDREKSWTDANGTVTWPWPKLERDDFLEPEKVYRFDISLLSRQWGINPGHRLRLELTGMSPASVCAPDPNAAPRSTYGMDPCDLTVPQQATVPGGIYRIMRGPDWPSALNLPQLTWQTFAQIRSGKVPTAYSEHHRRLEESESTLPLDWGSDTAPAAK